jgi:hypothetical protein
MEQLQRTESWHEKRLGRFTASQFSKLISKKDELTKGAMTYVLEKVTEIIIGDTLNNFESTAMIWGTDNEPDAVELYELVTGKTINKIGFVKYGDHAGGSPDGLIGEKGMIEIKCPFNSVNHIRYGLIEQDNEIPDEYYWQIQMNLLATGREWCDFVSYDPRCKYKIFIYTVYASAEAFERIENFLALAIEKKNELLTKLENKV